MSQFPMIAPLWCRKKVEDKKLRKKWEEIEKSWEKVEKSWEKVKKSWEKVGEKF